jgi:hypothetical protein
LGVKRVTIVPRPLVVMLVVLSLFALTGLGGGAMLLVFCKRIGATASGSTAFAIGAGIAFVLGGLKIGIWTVVQWRAIREIDVDADGTWRMSDNLGRRFTLPADRDAAVELVAYDVTIYRPLPKRLHQVAGRIVTADRTWRIATNAHSTYDRVVRELGIGDAAPASGLQRYDRRRVA